MSLVRRPAKNHPQQVAAKGANPLIDDRAVTPEDFEAFATLWGPFTVDVAADEHNARCARFYTRVTDGLTASWEGERVWCNPPYSNIEPWLAKAWDESTRAARIVMLLPANRTEQGWWHRFVEPYRDQNGWLRVVFLKGRMRFLSRGQVAKIGPNERPPFGCCLLIWEAPE